MDMSNIPQRNPQFAIQIQIQIQWIKRALLFILTNAWQRPSEFRPAFRRDNDAMTWQGKKENTSK